MRADEVQNFWKNKQMYDLPNVNKDLVYYLASEYTNTDPFIQEDNYLRAVRVGHRLFEKGIALIQPIASFHAAAKITKVDPCFETYKRSCYSLIDKADGLIVVKSKGVRSSLGVNAECEYAEKHKDKRKLIICYNEDTDEFYEVLNRCTTWSY